MVIKDILEHLWLELTDKNGRFPLGNRPGYIWIYILWCLLVVSFYLLQTYVVAIVVVALGVVYLLIRLVWWLYRTIPYRIRVFRTKRRAQKWRREAAKTHKPYFFTPEAKAQEMKRYKKKKSQARTSRSPRFGGAPS